MADAPPYVMFETTKAGVLVDPRLDALEECAAYLCSTIDDLPAAEIVCTVHGEHGIPHVPEARGVFWCFDLHRFRLQNGWRIALCLGAAGQPFLTDGLMTTLAHELLHVRDFNRMYGAVPSTAAKGDPRLTRWRDFVDHPMNEASVRHLAALLTARYLEDRA
jgi:hypothetical protein